MTTEQRLDKVESEFATIRQLLISAATYAESANRRIDELGVKQDRTQLQIDQLTIKQDNTQLQIDQLTIKQDRTQIQLDQLTEGMNQLSTRVDEFIYHTQRLFNKAGEDIEITKARTDRLEALMLRLDRNYEAQQSQMQEFKITTNAALERIDRILDYLLRQSGGQN